MEFGTAPTVKALSETVLQAPKSDSDEDIWEYLKEKINPIFHFAGTCKMGKEEDDLAVVDKNFRVRGLNGLRVVDHSVAPLMVNNHVQSTCYLIVSLSISRFDNFDGGSLANFLDRERLLPRKSLRSMRCNMCGDIT